MLSEMCAELSNAMQLVKKNLWSDPECHPPEATSEEVEAERRHYEGMQSQQANKKVNHIQRTHILFERTH